ncbi:heat shock protein HslJ [Actinokineospora baliensis]|uniref:META domain-containing protein n=1 Tax=Actinokineospora baliensis TaxID=547056 RepID=UPI00195E3B05|nr:META domain-containing protein [Actinokineospora baliensis]MBM7776392.1 heat shock protein HslJ [Actinokineospora baliensis]
MSSGEGAVDETEQRLRATFAERADGVGGEDLLLAVHRRLRRRRTARLTTAAVVVAVALVGGVIALRDTAGTTSSTAAGGAPMPAAGVTGTWEPLFVVGDSQALRPKPPLIHFGPDGRWTASDGCNDSQGRYTTGGPSFTATPEGGTTYIACDNVPNQAVLTKATTFTLRGDQLTFYDAAGQELGTYRRTGS